MANIAELLAKAKLNAQKAVMPAAVKQLAVVAQSQVTDTPAPQLDNYATNTNFNILLYAPMDDARYVSRIKALIPHGHHTFIGGAPSTLLELELKIKSSGCTHILCAHQQLLALLTKNPAATLSDYAGSVFTVANVEIIVLAPLNYFFKIPYTAEFFKRYIDKIIAPEKWLKIPDEVVWEIARPETYDKLLAEFKRAHMIAVDIETKGLLIKEVGFCGLWIENGQYRARSIVCPFKDNASYEFIKAICQDTPGYKVTQNGRYDMVNLYFWDIHLHNWLIDTYGLMHDWYSECPRDLAFNAAAFIRKFVYWKDAKNSTDIMERYFYNAKDTWVTLWAALQMLKEAPDYLYVNYAEHTFLTFFPALQGSLQGIKVDLEERENLRTHYQKSSEAALAKLNKILDINSFNANSYKQVIALMNLYGCMYPADKGRFKKSDKINLEKFKDLHPLNEFIYGLIKAARAGKKLISTYIDAPLFGDRMLFSINPWGTETGRCASKKSDLGIINISAKGTVTWKNYGSQVQNQTAKLKAMYIADTDLDEFNDPDNPWEFAEIDGSQAESRCTGYLSRDEKLIHAVETSPDFHCTNASLFFGIPFEQLYQISYYDQEGQFYPAKVLNKDVRTLAKRTNHGANYNMGEDVLVNTMGVKAILKARMLLNWPTSLTPKLVARKLLINFDSAYPRIRNKETGWYGEIIHEVLTTGKLVGPTGYTRRCFKDINTKPGLNAYVAHGPQSLSVMQINKCFYRVWHKYQITQNRIRIIAQIHDSIFFLHRRKDRDAVAEIAKLMYESGVWVHGKFMQIPNDPKCGALRWSDLKD